MAGWDIAGDASGHSQHDSRPVPHPMPVNGHGSLHPPNSSAHFAATVRLGFDIGVRAAILAEEARTCFCSSRDQKLWSRSHLPPTPPADPPSANASDYNPDIDTPRSGRGAHRTRDVPAESATEVRNACGDFYTAVNEGEEEDQNVVSSKGTTSEDLFVRAQPLPASSPAAGDASIDSDLGDQAGLGPDAGPQVSLDPGLYAPKADADAIDAANNEDAGLPTSPSGGDISYAATGSTPPRDQTAEWDRFQHSRSPSTHGQTTSADQGPEDAGIAGQGRSQRRERESTPSLAKEAGNVSEARRGNELAPGACASVRSALGDEDDSVGRDEENASQASQCTETASEARHSRFTTDPENDPGKAAVESRLCNIIDLTSDDDLDIKTEPGLGSKRKQRSPNAEPLQPKRRKTNQDMVFSMATIKLRPLAPECKNETKKMTWSSRSGWLLKPEYRLVEGDFRDQLLRDHAIESIQGRFRIGHCPITLTRNRNLFEGYSVGGRKTTIRAENVSSAVAKETCQVEQMQID
ncbi:hypothetical protein B0T10DRAFT_500983, partial [Thelonectria olida]